MTLPVSAEDRHEIHDLLGRYVWAVDTGDVDGIVSLFTPDGIVRYGDGEAYESRDGIRRFARLVTGNRGTRGRMHLNLPLFMVRLENGVTLRSYLCVVQWVAEPERKAIRTLSYSDDTCVRTGDGWRIKERVIWRWNDHLQPWSPDTV